LLFFPYNHFLKFSFARSDDSFSGIGRASTPLAFSPDRTQPFCPQFRPHGSAPSNPPLLMLGAGVPFSFFQWPMAVVPSALTAVENAAVSARRLAELLRSPDLDPAPGPHARETEIRFFIFVVLQLVFSIQCFFSFFSFNFE